MIRDAVDGLSPTRRASSSRPSRSVRRNYNNRAATAAGIDRGCVRAREGRSCNPAIPSSWNRITQRWAHCPDTPSSLARWDTGHPERTRWTRIKRPASASLALRWTKRRPSF